MTKTEARAQAKALRKNLDLHAIGAAMTQQLFALPAWRQAGTVFCFVSMRDEPDTTAILQQALVSGKRLCDRAACRAMTGGWSLWKSPA